MNAAVPFMHSPVHSHRETYDSAAERELYEKEKALEIRRPDGALRLRKLKPIHRTMILMHLEGKSHQFIAQALNRSYSNVALILSDPLAKAMINQALTHNQDRLKVLQIKAVDRVADALSSPSIEAALKGVDRMISLSDHLGIGVNQKETAEDVVQKILAQVNVQVNINSPKDHQTTINYMPEIENKDDERS